jgi:hypothetical protein
MDSFSHCGEDKLGISMDFPIRFEHAQSFVWQRYVATFSTLTAMNMNPFLTTLDISHLQIHAFADAQTTKINER